MKFVLCFSIICSCNAIFAQDSLDTKEVYVKDFEWRIQVPKGFDTISSRYKEKMQAKGRKMMEETINQKVEDNTTNLFTFRKGLVDYIDANYQAFDPKKDGNYLKSCKAIYSVMYETFKRQMAGKPIDTIHGIEVIDQLKFYTCIFKIYLDNGSVLHCQMYSRLFGKKDLTINVVYLTMMNGALAVNAIKHSTFGRKQAH